MLTYGHMYGPPGVLGIWGEGLFIFRVLGSTDNYFRELGSKLVVLGSPAKRKINKFINITITEMPPFCLI